MAVLIACQMRGSATRSLTSNMPTFPKFGSKVPFSEPSWYRGIPTPYYQEKHVAWRAKVRAFVENELHPFVDQWDEQKKFPVAELRKKTYEAGILSPNMPVELGGTPPEGGWDHFMNLIWHDELARSGSAGVNIILFGITQMSLPHTLHYGSEFLKQTVAVPVIKGECGISITLTEPQGGSDLANLTTTAVKTPCGKFYVVNGIKKFITGGLTSRYFSTAVRTGGESYFGVSMMVIDGTLPGVTVQKLETQGWWAGNTALVNSSVFLKNCS
jgi:alkylation response protein AidB-like acyl-CoA dehydrogenase